MVHSTGRFTTLTAGATVLIVVSVAFLLVFDLSTALGSSSELPIVRIGETDGTSWIGETGSTANTLSPAGAAQASGAATTQEGMPPGTVYGPGASGSKNDAGTDTTTREYVQENVRVQKDDGWPSHTTKPNSRDSDLHSPGLERR